MRLPGLVARHSWNGTLVLNDPNAWPRYKLLRIGGIRSLADPEDNRLLAAGRRGEITLPSVRRGKTVTYEGTILARSEAELEDADQVMREAFSELTEGEMAINSDLFPTVTYRARALTLEIPEEPPASRNRISYGYERPFALILRQSDPRYFSTQLVGPVETATLQSQTGTALPWSFPVAITAPGASSGTVAVDNIGDVDTDPIIDVYGPCTNPKIRNDTVGEDLVFRSFSLVSNSFVRVDFRVRTVKLEGTTDLRHKLDLSRSGWWRSGVPGLSPGINTIRFSAENASDPARAVITFYPATQ